MLKYEWVRANRKLFEDIAWAFICFCAGIPIYIWMFWEVKNV